MNARTITFIVLIVIVLAGLWWYFSGTSSMSMAPNSGAENTGLAAPTSPTTTTTSPAATGVTVDYTNNGFSPATVTIAQGQTVTYVNQSSESMWVASDPHPSHTAYDGTSRTEHCATGYSGPTPFDECASVPANGTYSFTFNKVGTWGYHNHMDPSMLGTVIVTASSTASGN